MLFIFKMLEEVEEELIRIVYKMVCYHSPASVRPLGPLRLFGHTSLPILFSVRYWSFTEVEHNSLVGSQSLSGANLLHADEFSAFMFFLRHPLVAKKRHLFGEHESPVWTCLFEEHESPVKKMNHLVEESESSGLEIFGIHKSSCWNTSFFFGDFQRFPRCSNLFLVCVWSVVGLV